MSPITDAERWQEIKRLLDGNDVIMGSDVVQQRVRTPVMSASEQLPYETVQMQRINLHHWLLQCKVKDGMPHDLTTVIDGNIINRRGKV